MASNVAVANNVTVANYVTVANNVGLAYKATVANKVTVVNNVTGNRRQNRPNMVTLLEDLFRVPHFSSDFKIGDTKQHLSASFHAPHMYHIGAANRSRIRCFCTALFGLSHTRIMQLLLLGQAVRHTHH